MKPSGFGLGGTYFITDAGIGASEACACAEAGSRTNNARTRLSVGDGLMERDYRSAAGVVQFPVPPVLEYLGQFLVQHVTDAGALCFQQRLRYLASARVDRWIGLEETDDGVWAVCCDTVLVATFDERNCIIGGAAEDYSCLAAARRPSRAANESNRGACETCAILNSFVSFNVTGLPTPRRATAVVNRSRILAVPPLHPV
jgi:hypothetical protein